MTRNPLGPGPSRQSSRRPRAASWLPVLRGLLAVDGLLPSLVPSDHATGEAWRLAAWPDQLDSDGVVALRRRLGERRPSQLFLPDGQCRDVVPGDPATRLGSRVALVTGAAQGFGRGIAEGLARLGCRVVLADLNLAGAQAVAQGIRDEHGPLAALALRVDVADEESFVAAVDEVLAHHGGLDLLVSNAGIVRAGAVTDLSPADFDLVTRVNYRGYFVAVRTVAPVMALQHLAAPQVWTDIVEVNSKSGLAGSKRNSAYAGSKFGGIGLTQSFALELVSQHTKVNAVCPGNFLDGPLWTDPHTGLFAQYLAAGKVPGATSVADVRAHYEAQVPMARGCTPTDVVRAIAYCVEQEYETGQAIPVTGGQTMLH